MAIIVKKKGEGFPPHAKAWGFQARRIDGGKSGKCLKLTPDSTFANLDDLYLGVVGNFAIVSWVKTRRISNQDQLHIIASSTEDNGSISLISLAISGSEIVGLIVDGEDDEVDGLISEGHSIDDNKWHHVAFSLGEDFYRLFIDGVVVAEAKNEGYTGFVGNDTLILLSSEGATIYLDEVGFFETGFSIYEVKGLYNDGLSVFLKAMPVDPQGRATTTWGEIKSRSER